MIAVMDGSRSTDRPSTRAAESDPRRLSQSGESHAFGVLGAPTDARTTRILAKSIHRDLSSSGWEAEDVMALASELLSSVATEMRSRRA